jgi:hypothetical protein
MTMRAASIPLWVVLMLAAGACEPKPAPAPVSAPAAFPTTLDGLLKYLNTFPPVQTLHGAALAERGSFCAAMKAKGAFGMQEVKDQKIADKVESVETWTFWGGISLFVVAAVALALIIKFPASWQLLCSLAGVFGTLGTLAFVFGRYAAFLVGGGWVLVPLILIGLVVAIWKNWKKTKVIAGAISRTLDVVKDNGYIDGMTKAALKADGADLKLAESIRQSAKG